MFKAIWLRYIRNNFSDTEPEVHPQFQKLAGMKARSYLGCERCFSLCVTCVSCAGVRGRVRWPCRKRSSCLRVWTSWRGKWKMRHVNWRPWPAPNKPSPRGSTALRWACCSSGSITQLCKQRSERRSCFVNGRAGWRILTAVRRERRTSGLFWEKPGRSRISAKIPRSERTSCAAWARSPASPPNSPSSRERMYLSTSGLWVGLCGDSWPGSLEY